VNGQCTVSGHENQLQNWTSRQELIFDSGSEHSAIGMNIPSQDLSPQHAKNTSQQGPNQIKNVLSQKQKQKQKQQTSGTAFSERFDN